MKLYEVTVTILTYAPSKEEAEQQVSNHLDTGDSVHHFEIQSTELGEEIDVHFEKMKAESLLRDLGISDPS